MNAIVSLPDTENSVDSVDLERHSKSLEAKTLTNESTESLGKGDIFTYVFISSPVVWIFFFSMSIFSFYNNHKKKSSFKCMCFQLFADSEKNGYIFMADMWLICIFQ